MIYTLMLILFAVFCTVHCVKIELPQQTPTLVQSPPQNRYTIENKTISFIEKRMELQGRVQCTGFTCPLDTGCCGNNFDSACCLAAGDECLNPVPPATKYCCCDQSTYPVCCPDRSCCSRGFCLLQSNSTYACCDNRNSIVCSSTVRPDNSRSFHCCPTGEECCGFGCCPGDTKCCSQIVNQTLTSVCVAPFDCCDGFVCQEGTKCCGGNTCCATTEDSCCIDGKCNSGSACAEVPVLAIVLGVLGSLLALLCCCILCCLLYRKKKRDEEDDKEMLITTEYIPPPVPLEVVEGLQAEKERLQRENEALRRNVEEMPPSVPLQVVYEIQAEKERIERENDALKKNADEAVVPLEVLQEFREENERLEKENEALRKNVEVPTVPLQVVQEIQAEKERLEKENEELKKNVLVPLDQPMGPTLIIFCGGAALQEKSLMVPPTMLMGQVIDNFCADTRMPRLQFCYYTKVNGVKKFVDETKNTYGNGYINGTRILIEKVIDNTIWKKRVENDEQ